MATESPSVGRCAGTCDQAARMLRGNHCIERMPPCDRLFRIFAKSKWQAMPAGQFLKKRKSP